MTNVGHTRWQLWVGLNLGSFALLALGQLLRGDVMAAVIIVLGTFSLTGSAYHAGKARGGKSL